VRRFTRHPEAFVSTLRRVGVAILFLLLPAVAGAQPADRLPPSESTVKDRLENTPRHGEFVDIARPDSVTIRAWISYPERSDKAGVVLVIHEVFGLSDWIRGVCDQLAKEGFIAVAPDLISGMGPGGGGTDSTTSRDQVVGLVHGVSPEMFVARMSAVRDWAVKLPAANGQFATIGFCWGGGRSFAMAGMQPYPKASVVYYGTSPDSAMILKTRAPVQGHYGGDDARVLATVDPARKSMKKIKRMYEVYVYEGAGHGFLRQQEDRDGANMKAAELAWPRTAAFLRQYLK
jgi:carboxymethylenebutenolidase